MKKLLLLSTVVIVAIGIAAANAQTPVPTAPAAPASAQRGPSGPQMRGDGPPPAAAPFSITRSDPDMDKIVDPKAKMIQIGEGFALSEAGLWVGGPKDGFWIFGGLLDNVLYKIKPTKTGGEVSVFMEKAGYTGNDPDHVGAQTRAGRHHVLLIGPSCTGMDHQGRIIWCADDDREVMRLEKDGTHTVLSAGMNGQKFSGPNDLAVSPDDTVYITDNDFGMRDGGKNPDKQLENGVYMIKNGTTTLALSDKDLGATPNGISITPDGKIMYLSTRGGMNKYPVNADGTFGPGTRFFTGPGAGDGQKVDTLGNVYSAGGGAPGHITVHAPDGRLLGMINVPIYGGEPKRQYCATNEAFGGPDGKTLFIAACDAAFTIRLKVAGPVPAFEVKN